MALEYILYCFFLIVTLSLVNITGKIALSLLNIKLEKNFFRIFLELVSGLIIIVLSYSVVKSGFKTINILFVFLFLYYYFFIATRKICIPQKNNLSNSFRNFHKDMLLIVLCCLPFFFFELYYLYSSSGLITPYADYFQYSEFSNTLNATGRENMFFSSNILFPEQFKGMQPYHYFELWLNAFTSKLFHCPSIFSLLLITYPCLNCIAFIGFIAIWETYYKVSFLSLVVIFLLLFTDGIYLSFYNKIPFISEHQIFLQTSIFTTFGKKFSLVYIFIIFSLILFIKNKITEAFIVLSSLLIISVGLIPGIGGGVFVFLLLNRFHGALLPKENRKLLIFYIALSFLFYLFYLVIGYSNKSASYVSQSSLAQGILSDISNINNYKYFFGMMKYRLIACFFLYLPYVIITSLLYITLIKNKDILKIIILVLLCNIMALVASVCAVGLSNDMQLLTNVLVLTTFIINFIIILGFIQFIQLRNKKNSYLYILGFSVIVVLNIINIYNNDNYFKSCFVEKYSKKYINNAIDETKNKSFFFCAALFSKQEYKTTNYEWLFSIKPGHVSQLTYGYRDIININAYPLFDSTKNMTNTDIYQMQISVFYIFTKAQKQQGSFKSYEQSQIDFLDKYNIKYVFANKDAELSDLLKSRVDKEITDTKSGERFYILKNKETIVNKINKNLKSYSVNTHPFNVNSKSGGKN